MIKRMTAIKAVVVAIFVVASMMFIVACGTADGAQTVPECTSNGFRATGCAVTIDYKGEPLNCVTWNGSGGETGLSCDFVEYHGVTNGVSDNPEGFN